MTRCQDHKWKTLQCESFPPPRFDAGDVAKRDADAADRNEGDVLTSLTGVDAPDAGPVVDGSVDAHMDLPFGDQQLDAILSVDAECYPGQPAPCTCLTCMGSEAICMGGKWVYSQCAHVAPEPPPADAATKGNAVDASTDLSTDEVSLAPPHDGHSFS